MTADEFRAMLVAEIEPYRRVQSFAALLAAESGLGTDGLTVVGGSALEIYTTGDYVSADVDLLAEDQEKVARVLRSWGFALGGMYWRHPEFEPSVQIVGKFDSGRRSLNQIVRTRYGGVRLASMEDIIWKRVYESRGWNRPAALSEAALLVRRYFDRLDWEYIEEMGRENRVEDLVADLRRTRGTFDPRRE